MPKPMKGRPMEEVIAKRGQKMPYHNNALQLAANGGVMPDKDHILSANIKLFNLPDIDLADANQIGQRLGEYFQIYAEEELKPTVAGMAMALGLTRQELLALRNGNYYNYAGRIRKITPEGIDFIKKAYKLLENLWESYMNGNKMNVVAGIFLGKNNFGYKDQQDVVVSPNNAPENDYSAEDIAKRYMIDSPTTTLNDSDS